MKENSRYLADPEISIWIDKYDDVFSEFDSRPFTDRALSDDFLREVHKMASGKQAGKVQLKFHLLDDNRNSESESIITYNLQAHFNHIVEDLKEEKRQILKKGYWLLGLGFILILFIFYLTTISSETAYLHGVILMLEPVGWFLTWTGLDQVFQTSRKNKVELDFNLKMASAEIMFCSFGLNVTENSIEQAKPKTVIPMDQNNLRVA